MVSRSSDGTFFQNECLVMSSGDLKVGTMVRVPVTTVEQLEAAHHLSFDTVFMDIQGGELGFLRENPDLLKRCKTLILEVHPHIIGEASCGECRDLMTAAGLCLVERNGLVEVWQSGRTDH